MRGIGSLSACFVLAAVTGTAQANQIHFWPQPDQRNSAQSYVYQNNGNIFNGQSSYRLRWLNDNMPLLYFTREPFAQILFPQNKGLNTFYFHGTEPMQPTLSNQKLTPSTNVPGQTTQEVNSFGRDNTPMPQTQPQESMSRSGWINQPAQQNTTTFGMPWDNDQPWQFSSPQLGYPIDIPMPPIGNFFGSDDNQWYNHLWIPRVIPVGSDQNPPYPEHPFQPQEPQFTWEHANPGVYPSAGYFPDGHPNHFPSGERSPSGNGSISTDIGSGLTSGSIDVPEPSTIGLFVLGLGLLSFRSYCRKKAQTHHFTTQHS